MATVSGTRVSVGSSATALNTASSTNPSRLIIKNTGSGDLDLGGSSVTSGAGLPLVADAIIEITVLPGTVIHAVHATTGEAGVLSIS